MKSIEVHKMKDAELREEEERLRMRLYELRAAAVTEKLENPKELGHIRRDIARILTEVKSRETAQTAGTTEVKEA